MNSFVKKHTLTISQTLGFGFGAIFLLVVVTNIILQAMHTRAYRATEDVVFARKIQFEFEQLEKLSVQAEAGQRGYLYTGNESFLEAYTAAHRQIDENMEQLKAQLKDEEQQKRLIELQLLFQARMAYLEETIDLAQEGKEAEVKARVIAGEGQNLMAQIESVILEIEAAENKLLAGSQVVAQQAKDLALFVVFLKVLSICGLGALILWTTNRVIQQAIQKALDAAESVAMGDLTYPIEVTSGDSVGKLLLAIKNMTQSLNGLISQVGESGIRVTSSTTQLASSSRQLEASITEQAASTSEITATAQEIATTASELAQTVEQVATMASDTATVASDGQQQLDQMETTIRQLAQGTESISDNLGLINEKANNINAVITTITKVADQTNLLSLNAAIEAEKAGEYGAGFAVVSREIRRLADQTAVATLEIETMVRDMQSAVATGVMEMDKFSKEINQGVVDVQTISRQINVVIDQIRSLTPQFKVASQGMDVQSQRGQQIRNSMEQLNDTSQQTFGAVRESNQAIDQLNEIVNSLHQELSRFRVSA